MHGHQRGLPIGNLISQLFANVYLDGFDHFVKETLREPSYLRYTDDAVILHPDKAHLDELIGTIQKWFWEHRRLELHPNKVILRKLSQGIDFLGYVTLPHYRVLRTKAKRRMFKRINETNLSSYLGMLAHCRGQKLCEQAYRLAGDEDLSPNCLSSKTDVPVFNF